MMSLEAEIRRAIRDVPDFPKAGILFRDITPLLGNAAMFRKVIAEFVASARAHGVTRVAGIDARGFLFGATVAFELGVGFVPIRKKGKLPFRTVGQAYDLEYGTAEIEVHTDAFRAGERVALVDDLLATGGTAAAALDLIRRAGAEPVVAQFLIELAPLGGRAALGGVDVQALVTYE